MKQKLPRFAEIADMRCQDASKGTKTINVKVAINTARMMVEAELAEHKNYRLLVECLRNCVKAQDATGGAKGSSELAATEGARHFLRQLGEIE